MKVLKKTLVNNIYDKLNKTVTKLLIYDVMISVTDYIIDELSQDRTFSVNNFGTFSLCKFHAHKGFNIHTGKMQHVNGFKMVKFRPHAVFSLLLKRKRKQFLLKE